MALRQILGRIGVLIAVSELRVPADRERRLDAACLDELLARAARQSATLEALRVSVADRALSNWGD